MPRPEATFTIDGHELRLSNLDKVLYPDTGFTKGQVIDYLAKIAPVLLPHLHDRPLTMKRYPNGVNAEFFYEKRAPKYRPSWIKTAHVTGGRDPAGIDYLLVNDLASLTWVANLADLELHPFLAKKQDVTRPTQIMFDLDPGAPADVTDCAQVALWIRDLLAGLKLQCWVKCSGSKGLQLHIPLNTPTSYDETKPFAKALAMAMTAAHPDRVVYDMKKAIRGGKVLIDWSQNDESKTTICVYSLRAKSQPYIAAPLEWSEVEACLKKDDPSLVFFGPDEVLARVKKKGDLMKEVLTLKQKLPKGAAEALGVLAQEPAEGAETKEEKPKPARAAKKPKPAQARSAARAEKRDLVAGDDGSLARYNAKRNFKITAEPAGQVEKSPTSKAALFVIQKHDASRLHYDFRLAMDGVLKSWAVPKGIPTAHGEKHLAVEVEDHPMSYARFEGIIPPGQYGGGTVMVWDIGEYRMLGGQPLEAWKQGMMHMRFAGKKMKGEWTLIRTRMQGGKNQWLLLKSGPDDAKITAKQDDQSALSGRSMAQIAKAKDKEWQSNRTRQAEPIEATAHEADTAQGSRRPPGDGRKKKPSPIEAPARVSSKGAKLLAHRFVEPMKCLPVKKIPEGAEWIYELKFDGYRSLALVHNGEALLLSRNKKPFNERFPALAEAVAKLKVKDAILDGEIVALDEHNRPTFQLLQNYERGPLAYYFFDLLSLDGVDWKHRPLHERKARLGKLLQGAKPPLFFSASLPGTTEAIWKQIQKQKLEGIIAKRRDSTYEPGRRSGEWAKIKAINVQEFVIGGYSEPQGGRSHFGALLVGVYRDKKLHFCAKVGTGFSHKLLAKLHAQMQPLRTAKCPFDNLPTQRTRWGGGVTASDMKQCTWLEPKLVCEVEFTEWTGDSSLRHPAFVGLREDVKPRAVHREMPVESIE